MVSWYISPLKSSQNSTEEECEKGKVAVYGQFRASISEQSCMGINLM